MLVPGSNLLAMALGVIGSQTVEWRRYTGQTTTAAGLKVDTWADPVPLAGSLQPVDSAVLHNLGLDWTKSYARFYAPADVGQVQRDRTGDKLTWNGRTFQVLDKSDWFGQDGWAGVLCVEVQ